MEVLFSDQLEEGEIVDDEQTFETISDDSIIDCTLGKLAPTKDHLRALSLSSSASGTDGKGRETRRQHHRRKRRHIKHERKRHKTPLFEDSSDDDLDLYQTNHIKRKLKEAIHISGMGGESRKSLQSRLKLMRLAQKEVDSDFAIEQLLEAPPPPIISEPEPPQTVIENNTNKVDDSELENLRLEALKTAIMNKVARRKRRKALQLDKDVKTLENKENDSNETAVPSKDVVEEASTKKPCLEQNTDESSTNKPNILSTEADDVDEDVLRAELLRNMAKKITKTLPIVKETPPPIKVATQPPPLKVDVVSARMKTNQAQVTRSIPSSLTSTKLVLVNNKLPKKPQVPVIKPLIIQVNKDSDSDSDVVKPNRKIITDEKIDKFLQEQWTQWKSSQVEEKTDILEKSAVNLLPKSQQLEYRLLLRKLKNAERQNKVKRLQKTTKTITKTTVVVKQPVANEQQTSNTNQIATNDNNNEAPQEIIDKPRLEIVQVVASAKQSDASTDTDDLENCKSKVVTTALTILRTALKDMRTPRKDGSLQMRSVYQVLTPVMRKITQTSNERKKHEKRIRDLTKFLDEAKNNLAKSHDKFSHLVDEFVQRKANIDESLKHEIPPNESAPSVQRGVSTFFSLKQQQPPPEVIIASVSEQGKDEVGRTDLVENPVVTSTPLKVHSSQQPFDVCAISTFNQSDRNSEDMDICNSTSEEAEPEPEIDIVDPNDIDQIFTRKQFNQPDKAKFPEYISPLNYYVRYKNVDPHGIMCPYEVNGSCRDTECSFKHYLKGD